MTVVGNARVTRGLHEQTQAFALFPLHDAVTRDIGEHEIAAVLDPQRPFRPLEVRSQDFDPGVLGHQLVQPRVFAVDLAERGDQLGLSAAAAVRAAPQPIRQQPAKSEP